MAAGAWDQTAAIQEFIAAHAGVKSADRAKLNPYRHRQGSGWGELFATGKAMLAAKRKAEASANGSG